MQNTKCRIPNAEYYAVYGGETQPYNNKAEYPSMKMLHKNLQEYFVNTKHQMPNTKCRIPNAEYYAVYEGDPNPKL